MIVSRLSGKRLASFPGLHAQLKSWAWRPGSEARKLSCQVLFTLGTRLTDYLSTCTLTYPETHCRHTDDSIGSYRLCMKRFHLNRLLTMVSYPVAGGWVSTFSGMEWWNGIVEWTTGMVADDHQALIWDIQPMPQSIEVPIAMLQRERSTKWSGPQPNLIGLPSATETMLRYLESKLPMISLFV